MSLLESDILPKAKNIQEVLTQAQKTAKSFPSYIFSLFLFNFSGLFSTVNNHLSVYVTVN